MDAETPKPTLEEHVNERRISKPSHARTINNRMDEDAKKRDSATIHIRGQLNGAQPYDQAQLTQTGQGWRCNVNFGDAASMLERQDGNYWKMLHDAANLITITMHVPDLKKTKWEQAMQKNFKRFIMEDWADDYVRNYKLFSYNHLAFGVGAATFNDMDSPRWKAVRHGDYKIPERSESSVNSLEMVMVKHEMTVSDLWELIRTDKKKEASEKRGWNIPAIRKYLHNHLDGKRSEPSETDLMEMEDDVRNNSFGISMGARPCSLMKVLIKEFDGEVAQMIFDPHVGQDADGADEQWLFDNYQSKNRAKEMKQHFTAVFFEVGENGQWHGVKGFGHKNYQVAMILNRIKCKIVERMMVEGLNFKDKSNGARTTIPITNIGPYNFLPEDVEQIPSYPGASTAADALGMVENTQNWNNAHFRNNTQQIERTETATQARILSGLQADVDVSNATLYLFQIANNLFIEQLSRLRRKSNPDPDAKKFIERCIKDGVPPEYLHDAECSVRTGADPGSASAALRAEVAFTLVGMRNHPLVKDREALVEWVANTLGGWAVDKFIVEEDQLGNETEVRVVLIENMAMSEGYNMPVSEYDDHVVHIENHLPALEQIIQQSQEAIAGAMPQDQEMPTSMDGNAAGFMLQPNDMITFEAALPHLEQHFNLLKQDEILQEDYQRLWPIYSQIVSAYQGLAQQTEAQAMRLNEQRQLQDQGIYQRGLEAILQDELNEEQNANQNNQQTSGANQPAPATQPTL